MQQARGQAAVTVYPVTSYSFGVKDRKQQKDAGVFDFMGRLKAKCVWAGRPTPVEGKEGDSPQEGVGMR
jgi:hypothetical protein